jgi:hypothetical protein
MAPSNVFNKFTTGIYPEFGSVVCDTGGFIALSATTGDAGDYHYQTPEYKPSKVKCVYCGQWGDVMSMCLHCGAPVDP